MIKRYRRVNILAGPGCGKSTTAAWLWSELKIAGFNIEYVSEYVKKWAFEKKSISSFDQVYLFAKQMYKEDSYLKSGADFIISDSPILQVGGYATRNNDPFKDELISIAKKFNETYPSINIFLDRSGIDYQREGRYEDYNAAVETDKFILDTLREHDPDYEIFRTVDRKIILEHIITKLNASYVLP